MHRVQRARMERASPRQTAVATLGLGNVVNHDISKVHEALTGESTGGTTTGGTHVRSGLFDRMALAMKEDESLVNERHSKGVVKRTIMGGLVYLLSDIQRAPGHE